MVITTKPTYASSLFVGILHVLHCRGYPRDCKYIFIHPQVLVYVYLCLFLSWIRL